MHRRHLITGIPAIWLAAATPAHALARKPSIEDMVAELTKALEDLHGGEWKPTIDAKHDFVMICRG